MRKLPAVMMGMLVLAMLALALSPARADSDAAHASTAELADGGWWRGQRLAAVIVRLAPGWKTYWRVPGEGGLPPRFDFSGSENVKDWKVLWPAPRRYGSEATGETIGYADEVVFPLLVTPRDRAKPVILRLKLDYGICGDMCVPVQVQKTITLPPKMDAAPARAVLEKWLRKTPLADDGRVQLADVRLVKTTKGLALEVVLTGPEAGRVTDIFVEGVELAIFNRPEKVGENGGRIVYRLPVRGLAEEKDFRGARLRLTILRGEKAVERTATLP